MLYLLDEMNSLKRKLSIVIPAYNEEKGIRAVIQGIKKVMKEKNIPGEILVVNDGSQDKTFQIAKESGVTVINHPMNFGYGRALKTGILAAKNDDIIITDADGTYPIEEIPALIKFMGEGFDMVIGARRGSHYDGRFSKGIARKFFKLLGEFVTGTKIPDINSGFRAFRKSDIIQFLKFTCSTFSFTTSLTIIYTLEGKFIKYYPIKYLSRKGVSKVHYFKDTLRTGQILTEMILLYNPIKLFLLIAFCLAGVSLISFTVYVFGKDTLFLVLFSVFFLSCIISICLGFIASIFKKSNR